MAPSMADTHILDAIQECFKTCQLQHKMCRISKPFLPRRVLDIRERSDDSITLNLTRKNERCGYIALSYCWGNSQGPQQLTTTKKSLKERMSIIKMADIPQTLLDAIWITRLLGFKYLWVDSLCIIQDDVQDVSREIGLMGEVYKGAAFTISASNVTSVFDGFLRLRRPRVYGWSSEFPLEYHDQEEWAHVSYKVTDKVDPIEKRAWTFQESLLSRRLLTFGEGEIGWRCQHKKFPPKVSDEIIDRSDNLMRLPSSVFGARKVSIRVYGRQQILLWEEIVRNYSKRELTFSHDRLPGIAGVASELAKVWDDTYLAGLWGSCLLNHLGWHPESGLAADWRPETYISPSWSWASVMSGVSFADISVPSAEVVSCTVKPMVEAVTFGQVMGGELIIRAVDVGNTESPLCHSIRNLYPSTDGVAKYPLLGYTSKLQGVGMILTPHGNRKYQRTGLWEMDLKVVERIWCKKQGAKRVFSILSPDTSVQYLI